MDVPQADLDELTHRLDKARWPDQLPGVAWRYGADLTDLVDYWRTGYDQRTHEARLATPASPITEATFTHRPAVCSTSSPSGTPECSPSTQHPAPRRRVPSAECRVPSAECPASRRKPGRPAPHCTSARCVSIHTSRHHSGVYRYTPAAARRLCIDTQTG
ncbi:MAG TPA: epoxide hydrolase N-terminal domain-containing protein [Pseudonocardiaceae bacterium]|nr:epoxide hydrolase N-terminal domain-containing protein [Pseudonocardiaceae bacterium]